jgi:5-methyltetrahydropteroyltriglutamate--homocysteine methyltransferase
MASIRTTHTGSLPRPAELVDLLVAQSSGRRRAVDEERLETVTRASIADVVRRQREVGIDVVNDGEMGKVGYSTYIHERLSGFGGATHLPGLAELRDYPEYAERLDASFKLAQQPACNGPVALVDPDAVHRDIANLLAVTDGDPTGSFLSAASPGVISVFFGNEYYKNREDFLGALVDAMRPEYEAIVNAGLILQLDCPDLAMGRNMRFARLTADDFLREAALNIEALNAAVADLPQERIRIHVCWGNYEAPHHLDIPLRQIVETVLRATPHGLCIEASNPRHAHEWKVFEDVALPEGKYLIPGVIDSTSNYIDHPELVAQRLARYVDTVGAQRVMAGTDCGFGTFAGMALVEPRIAWAKLGALVEGARLASS